MKQTKLKQVIPEVRQIPLTPFGKALLGISPFLCTGGTFSGTSRGDCSAFGKSEIMFKRDSRFSVLCSHLLASTLQALGRLSFRKLDPFCSLWVSPLKMLTLFGFKFNVSRSIELKNHGILLSLNKVRFHCLNNLPNKSSSNTGTYSLRWGNLNDVPLILLNELTNKCS